MPTLTFERIAREVAGWRIVLRPTQHVVFSWGACATCGGESVAARGFDKADTLRTLARKLGINQGETLQAFGE